MNRQHQNDDSFSGEMKKQAYTAPLASHEDSSSELNWTRRHALLINNVFNSFEESNLRYVVIRNDGQLPDYNTSKDVDILIDPNCTNRACELVLKNFREFGVTKIIKYNFGNITCLYGIDFDSSFAIHVDIISGYAPKGFRPFSFEEIYNYRKRANGFWALNQQFGAVFLLVYKIFGYSRPYFKRDYVTSMKIAQDIDPEYFHVILKSFLGNKLAGKLMDAVARGSIADIIATKRSLDWRLRLRSLKLFPIATLARPPIVFLDRFLSLQRKIFQSASSLALLGGHSQDFDKLKDELRRELGKTFVRDGREFVEIREFGEAKFPDRRFIGGVFEFFAWIRRSINAARSDRVLINVINPKSILHDVTGKENIIRKKGSSLILMPKYLIRFEGKRVDYYEKRRGFLMPRYVLVASECLQHEIDNAQISRFITKFFLEKLTNPLFGI